MAVNEKHELGESSQRVDHNGISYDHHQNTSKDHLNQFEEVQKYDHRILGVKQELIFCHEELSPGSLFFLPHGARIYNKLTDFIQSQYRVRGYEEVISPNVFKMDLWDKQDKMEHYKEDMFTLQIEKQKFGLKTKNGPGHCLVFKHKGRSYRELPLRFADFGVLHRKEASNAPSGLTQTHVRRFQQDDAYIFCRESQIKDEVIKSLNFIDYVYQIFGFTYELKLSTMPERYLKDFEMSEKAENALREALDGFGKPWQLDFQLPDSFKLGFSAEDEDKVERPVMIHRAILGTIEDMSVILLERYKGKWLFWLSPRQAILCPVSEKSQAYALQVLNQIHRARYYLDVDTTDMNIQNKVQKAQLAEYNYILVVGEEEASTGQVSVHVRDKAEHSVMSIEKLLKHFRDEVAAFH